MSDSAALQDSIYLDGVLLVRPPDSLDIEPMRWEDTKRLADGTDLTTSPFWYDGAGDACEKLTGTLGWTADIREGDLSKIRRVTSKLGSFTLCYWQRVTEQFTLLDGAPRAGLLARRIALSVLTGPDVGMIARYATVVLKNGSVVSAPTFDSPDANDRTPWHTTGAASGVEVWEFDYVPLLTCRVNKEKPLFGKPHLRSHSFAWRET